MPLFSKIWFYVWLYKESLSRKIKNACLALKFKYYLRAPLFWNLFCLVYYYERNLNINIPMFVLLASYSWIVLLYWFCRKIYLTEIVSKDLGKMMLFIPFLYQHLYLIKMWNHLIVFIWNIQYIGSKIWPKGNVQKRLVNKSEK